MTLIPPPSEQHSYHQESERMKAAIADIPDVNITLLPPQSSFIVKKQSPSQPYRSPLQPLYDSSNRHKRNTSSKLDLDQTLKPAIIYSSAKIKSPEDEIQNLKLLVEQQAQEIQNLKI
jgi:hypothetical protein